MCVLQVTLYLVMVASGTLFLRKTQTFDGCVMEVSHYDLG